MGGILILTATALLIFGVIIGYWAAKLAIKASGKMGVRLFIGIITTGLLLWLARLLLPINTLEAVGFYGSFIELVGIALGLGAVFTVIFGVYFWRKIRRVKL